MTSDNHTADVIRLTEAADRIKKATGQPLTAELADAVAALLKTWTVLLLTEEPSNRPGNTEVLRLADAAAAAPVSRIVQLKDAIVTQGGRWNAERATAFYISVGFPATKARGKHDLERVAESYPELLVPVEGAKTTYDVNTDPDRP